MNIVLNTLKSFNNSYITAKKVNHNNLAMTSPLQADTFIKSNVSFNGKSDNVSELQQARVHYEPKLPKVFRDNGINNFEIKEGKKTESVSDQKEIQTYRCLSAGDSRFAERAGE